MYTDYYSQRIYEYLQNYIYPILQTISSNLITFNNNFNVHSRQLLFILCFFVFLYLGFKFIKIRGRTVG